MIELEYIYKLEDLHREIRSFFKKQNFHEVFTPILHESLPLEPTIYPFQTLWHAKIKKNLYLSTSPESTLKKLLAQGIGNCFSISKSFRNLEDFGPYHLPEFLMLEWYRTGKDYTAVMEDVKQFISTLTNNISESKPLQILMKNKRAWEPISLHKLFKTKAAIDFDSIDKKQFFALAKKRGYGIFAHTTWEQIYNQIFLNEIYPHLPNYPIFLVDFPKQISPLSKSQKSNPFLAERFELLINKIEIANGNTEELVSSDVKTIFFDEVPLRIKTRTSMAPIDKEFLNSLDTLDSTGSTYAGVGLGVERLFMLLNDIQDIRKVVLQHVI